MNSAMLLLLLLLLSSSSSFQTATTKHSGFAGLCLCWLPLHTKAPGYYRVLLPRANRIWDSLLPELHTRGFVIFIVWQDFLDSVGAMCGRQSFVLNWSPACAHICIHCFVLFRCRTHPNYLIYSERVTVWLWTVWTMMRYERDTWIQMDPGRWLTCRITMSSVVEVWPLVWARWTQITKRARRCFLNEKSMGLFCKVLLWARWAYCLINLLSCIRRNVLTASMAALLPE